MTYGLTDTSLEEIFMSVAEQSEENNEDETIKCKNQPSFTLTLSCPIQAFIITKHKIVYFCCFYSPILGI